MGKEEIYEGNAALEKAELLTELKVDQLKWKIYYHDEELDEYWVLEYPDSGYHGGGIPMLKRIDKIP